ncbi:MAG: hypothetical protein KDB53_00310, partial [Planctomycetes bacterium]|nr:hypothetical protein [Planctomycetota bacterium]
IDFGEEPMIMGSTSELVEQKKIVVKSIGDAGVTAVLVTYDEVTRNVERVGGGERRGGRRRGQGGGEGAPERIDPSELSGKSFLVSVTGAESKVTDAAGGEVEEAMATLVLRREVAAGRIMAIGPDLRSILADKDLKIGDVLSLDGASALTILPGSGPGNEPESARLILKLEETKAYFGRQCAVFDVDLKIKPAVRERSGGRRGGQGRQGGPQRMEVPEQALKGKILIGVKDMRVYRLDLMSHLDHSSEMQRGERTIQHSTKSSSKSEYVALPFKAEG